MVRSVVTQKSSDAVAMTAGARGAPMARNRDAVRDAADRAFALKSMVRLSGIAALAAMLAGCGLMEKKEPPPPCPRIGILGDVQKSVQFRPGPGRDLTDVAFEAELLDFNGSCKYEGRNLVTVTFTLQVAATRGPAAEAREALVPYFVAVVDKQRGVLSREGFTARLPFPSGRRRIAVGEELEQRIPLGTRSSSDIEILIGLELDQEQLDGNRRKRGF